nr:sulfotransferase [Arhodomonas sp. KWT]
MTHQDVIIIGAPRSGTNMLRDVLCSLEGVATWPCDEINYIWRHGNVRYGSDEFVPSMADGTIAKYIRRQFDWVARRYRAHTVVEKTCANSLRVPFVDRVVPQARYLFIYRDGFDAVGSAMKRWKAQLDIPYLARKARFVPATDLPYYAFRYFWNRVYRLFSGEERLAFWGPQLDGMQRLLEKYSLEEVCALQWKRCVEMSHNALEQLPHERVCSVRYEHFVDRPLDEFSRIAGFLGLEVSEAQLARAVRDVSAKSVGRGRHELGEDLVNRLAPLVGETRQAMGYV